MSRSPLAVLLLSLSLLAGCGDAPEPEEPSATSPGVSARQFDSPEEFVEAQKGKVVVLLLGMKGCAATHQATKVLAAMAPEADDGVAFARIDVPPPNGTVQKVEDWSHPYHYDVDWDRTVADPLDFYYYPTLYLLDGEGEVRYSGGCDRKDLQGMIAEVRGEEPGAGKKMFTRPLPRVGSKAPVFEAKDLEGDDFEVASFIDHEATLLFFGSVGCPFSRDALEGLPDVELDFEEHDIRFVTVEKFPTADRVKEFVADLDLPGTVIHDPKGVVCGKYGVEPVPFFFVIDGEGKIAARGPYAEATVRQALASAIGIEFPDVDHLESKGAG